jgi:hypothetical protein
MLHPENLGEIVHLYILFGPPVEFGGRVFVLVTSDVSGGPFDGAREDHLAQGAK